MNELCSKQECQHVQLKHTMSTVNPTVKLMYYYKIPK